MKKNEIPKIILYILSSLIFLLLVFFIIIRPSITLFSSPNTPYGKTVYPEDFPPELKFSENISLTSSASGSAMIGDKQGWSAESVFNGKPADAEKIVVEHFLSLGWTIFERGELESGQVVLLLVQDQSDAVVVFDVDQNDDSQTIIMSTLFK